VVTETHRGSQKMKLKSEVKFIKNGHLNFMSRDYFYVQRYCIKRHLSTQCAHTATNLSLPDKYILYIKYITLKAVKNPKSSVFYMLSVELVKKSKAFPDGDFFKYSLTGG